MVWSRGDNFHNGKKTVTDRDKKQFSASKQKSSQFNSVISES